MSQQYRIMVVMALLLLVGIGSLFYNTGQHIGSQPGPTPTPAITPGSTPTQEMTPTPTSGITPTATTFQAVATGEDVKTMVPSSLLSGGVSTTSLVDQVRLLILLLIVTLLVALLSRRLRVPYTLLLVIVGLVVGLFPLLPHEHIDPDLILYVFIPALLFEGAWNAEIDRLKTDWLPIVLLAVPGMMLSLLVVAPALSWGIGLPWLLALLVGAIVAPTDPVSVIALFGQLGVPDRLRTLVEGESIFNDGTAGAAYELILAVLLPTLG